MPLLRQTHEHHGHGENNMNNETQTHETTDRSPRSPEDFARQRAREVDAQLKGLETSLANISSRVEDVAGIAGEIGAHTLPSEKERAAIASRGMFAKGVHWVDDKLTQAGPYLRAGAAVVAAGGAVYGGVKGAQAAYRWATTPSADAKAMPVSES